MSRAASCAHTPARPRLAGVRQIARLNWTSYAAAAAVAIGTVATVAAAHLEPLAAAVLLAMGLLPLGWALVSLVVAAWVYDFSPLRDHGWVPALLPRTPRRWLTIHTGLDETSAALERLFPSGRGLVFDAFDVQARNSPSIRRARARAALPTDVQPAPARPLPAAEGALDAVFLVFAAHELRRPAAREALFREVARVLAPGGTALVVEHVRDVANFAAFGPGAFHFQPVREWRRLATVAALTIDLDTCITPFVRVLRLRKEA